MAESLHDYAEEKMNRGPGKGGRPKTPRPDKLGQRQSGKLLEPDHVSELVDLLERCSGDLEVFVYTFDATIGSKQSILTRSLYLLSQKGNEEHLERWNRLIVSFRSAKMFLLENDALTTISLMAKPNEGSPLLDWQRYASIWMASFREEAKLRVKTAARPVGVVDPEAEKNKRELAAVEAIAAAIRAARED